MSTFKHHLLRLCAELEAHENITHWAISNRIFGRGAYFRDLRDKPRGDVKGAAYEKAMAAFSEMWPLDLEWPSDIPRPSQKEDAA